MPPSSPEIEGESAARADRTAVRVSSMQVRGLSEALEQAGLSAAAFIARTNLDVERMADPYGWFTLAEFDALMVSAVALSEDPAFGLHWGERSPMMQFDLAPTLVATAPTLRVAIECLLQFLPILASQAEFRFVEQRERCMLVCDVLAQSEHGVRIRNEVVTSGLSRLLRYLGSGDAIRRVNVTHARPPWGAEYDRIFGALVHFEQPETSLEFACTALDRPHPHRNAELHQILRERTEQLRLRALGQQSYAEQLEQQIRAALPRLLGMAEAARTLELSERSLRRRLAQEAISYTELVDRVQHRLADALLSLGNKSVKEIAYALGFSSESGFHRAFRRWTGGTPAHARSPRARS
jgi:AraC-like DNA-binding protein